LKEGFSDTPEHISPHTTSHKACTRKQYGGHAGILKIFLWNKKTLFTRVRESFAKLKRPQDEVVVFGIFHGASQHCNVLATQR
jgi:hypothetical protein